MGANCASVERPDRRNERIAAKMNQPQPYMDMHSSPHLTSGPSYSHSAAPAPMPHYPQYQQPPVMPPTPGHYGPPQSYGGYGYPSGVTSPQSAGGHVGSQVQSQGIQLPGMLESFDH